MKFLDWTFNPRKRLSYGIPIYLRYY